MAEPHQVIWWRHDGISWPLKSAVYMFVLRKILATNDSKVPKEAFPPRAETYPWQLTSSSHLKIPPPATPKPHFFQSQMESTSLFFQGFWLCIFVCCAQSCNRHFFFTSPNPVISAKQRDLLVDYWSNCQVLLSSGLILPVLYGDSLLLFLKGVSAAPWQRWENLARVCNMHVLELYFSAEGAILPL